MDNINTQLPFSGTVYEKLEYAVFPTIRRRDKYGQVGDINEIMHGKPGNRESLGFAEIIAKETVTIEKITRRFFEFDTNSDSFNEAVDSINEFYENPIEPDEELTLYWNKWVPISAVEDRVFDGQITQGFNEYRLATMGFIDGAEQVQVMKRTRKHVFGRGYVSDGSPEISVTHRLGPKSARAVRDLLDWWLERQGDTDTSNHSNK